MVRDAMRTQSVTRFVMIVRKNPLILICFQLSHKKNIPLADVFPPRISHFLLLEARA